MRVDVRGDRATELHATLTQEDYVYVEGRLRYAKWVNKRGEKHECNLVEAERVAVEPDEG
ncbi:Single-strand binding protein family protein [compost metagenome]